MRMIWTVAAVLFTAGGAQAQIYKCPDAGGHTVIQQLPCAGGNKVDVRPASGAGPDAVSDAFREAHEARMKLYKKTNADCDARGVTALTIGMDENDALCVPGWRFPKNTNTTTAAGVIRQQVVYGGFGKYDDPPKFLYFENGKLTAVQN